MNETTTISPSLGKPGAGLPLFDLLISKGLFGIYRARNSVADALELFLKESDHMRRLTSALPEERGATQVLIPRISGIEDSSRFWSPYMVLHHLVIVNGGIMEIIKTLSNGHTFPNAVSTALVKPAPGIGSSIIEKFVEQCAQYKTLIERTEPKKDSPTHIHPWFGPLSAHGWHCLAAVHHSVHRRQIQKILTVSANARLVR